MGNFKFSLPFAALFVFGMIFTSCQKDNVLNEASKQNRFMTTVPDDCDVAPIFNDDTSNGGNAECPVGYDETSGRLNIDEVGYEGTSGPISWTITDGKYISWTGDVCGITIIVKGGNGSNIYTCENCTGTSGLHAPANGGGIIPDISNVTFCWTECPIEELPLECTDETAFGGSTAGGGNAWFYVFDTQGASSQPIYAGKELTDGTIHYDGTYLHIDLGSWTLQEGNQTVKVEGYNVIPSRRPAAGQFKLYKGTDLTVTTNGSRYYIIHLDLSLCE